MPTKKECAAIFKSVIERYNKKQRQSTPFRDILNNETEFEREINSILEECGKKGKFMQGSDIEGIVNDAMFNYYLHYWKPSSDEAQNDPSNGAQRYIPSKFYSEIREAIDSVCTYGETDSTKIAICLLGLASNKFKSASSDNNLIEITDVNPKEVLISEFKGIKTLTMSFYTN